MTLDDLRIFVAACRTGSLSAVARELGCTQSAVSQHVSRLESELGLILLERMARGVEPTDAGQILNELAQEGLESIEQGLQRMRALREGETSTLTITTGGTTVRHFFRRAVVRFREAYPDVNLRFQPASSTRRCFEILRRRQADLAFVSMGHDEPGVGEHPVAEQRFFLLVQEWHPLSSRRELRMQDLATIRYLGLAHGTAHRDALDAALAGEGVTLKAEMELDDFDTACIFVELGLGQAICPAMQAHNFARGAGVGVIPIVDLPPVSVGWAYRRSRPLTPPARDFISVFQQVLADMGEVPGLKLLST
ncbi:MAG: LysR family transcriptional regulator [Ectothiorhodospiraceae bacterium]|nr:LysR family transcriptional regulator [Ectothiorhodospiraceae bacterium]